MGRVACPEKKKYTYNLSVAGDASENEVLVEK